MIIPSREEQANDREKAAHDDGLCNDTICIYCQEARDEITEMAKYTCEQLEKIGEK